MDSEDSKTIAVYTTLTFLLFLGSQFLERVDFFRLIYFIGYVLFPAILGFNVYYRSTEHKFRNTFLALLAFAFLASISLSIFHFKDLKPLYGYNFKGTLYGILLSNLLYFPAGLIGASLGRVFYKNRDPNKQTSSLLSSIFRAFLILIAVLIILFVIVTILFALSFNPV